MSTRESRRIQQLRRRVVRLERELAALKAAPPAYVPVPYVQPSFPTLPWQLPVYPANPTPIIITDTSQPYMQVIDTTVTATTTTPVIFNTHD